MSGGIGRCAPSVVERFEHPCRNRGAERVWGPLGRGRPGAASQTGRPRPTAYGHPCPPQPRGFRVEPRAGTQGLRPIPWFLLSSKKGPSNLDCMTQYRCASTRFSIDLRPSRPGHSAACDSVAAGCGCTACCGGFSAPVRGQACGTLRGVTRRRLGTGPAPATVLRRRTEPRRRRSRGLTVAGPRPPRTRSSTTPWAETGAPGAAVPSGGAAAGRRCRTNAVRG